MLYFILSSFMGHNNFPIMYGLLHQKDQLGHKDLLEPQGLPALPAGSRRP